MKGLLPTQRKVLTQLVQVPRLGASQYRFFSSDEDTQFATRVASMKAWMGQDRFNHIKRPYGAEDVIRMQGTFPLEFASTKMSEKLYTLMRKHQARARARTHSDPLTQCRSPRWQNT